MNKEFFHCTYKELRVNTVEDITHAIREIQAGFGNLRGLLMRGEKNTEYVPTAGTFRSDKGKQTERDVFWEFLRNLPLHSTVDSGKVWDVLTLAQHHGLPTRLLDWTISPLVATYFAIEGLDSSDAAVWAVWGFEDQQELPEDPFDIERIYSVVPLVLSPRVHAQSGRFTLHPDGRDLRGFLGEEDYCLKLVIPGQAKAKMLLRLDFLRINRATLFPDLDGLCHWLKWRALEVGA